MPNAITKAGPSHQSELANKNEIRVTAKVGAKWDALSKFKINFI
jgi:hypothetical protein